MEKNYFEAHSWWKIPEAVNYATAHGMATKMEDGKLFIEIKYEAGMFHLEDVYEYSGFLRYMNDWNGWEQPYFTKDITQRIAQDYNDNEFNGPAFYWEGEVLVYTHEDEECCERIEPITIHCDGADHVVYPMGMGWIWSRRKPQTEE